MSHNEVAGAGEIEREQVYLTGVHHISLNNLFRTWRVKVDPEISESGLEMAGDAVIWSNYVEEGKRYDNDLVECWNWNMDMLLVFVNKSLQHITHYLSYAFDRLAYSQSCQQLSLLNFMNSFSPTLAEPLLLFLLILLFHYAVMLQLFALRKAPGV
jgi:hypothetical protein